ncbi:hypothetical protein FCV50_23195 [Vibrio kanaloae]|uniref:Uncharacterized protein n=1 Tax=Vibrio kanaloae TaxID=170673 RepID=A0A4U1YSI9_9VIBR|nr:hypothetical protein [Vibrio kanaloae]TKF24020.1 hypothetical protein FCV50_23195 [Vibrio kanaloae]
MRPIGTLGLAMLVVLTHPPLKTQLKPLTIRVNNQVKEDLPFSDKKDFENTQKGFLLHRTSLS